MGRRRGSSTVLRTASAGIAVLGLAITLGACATSPGAPPETSAAAGTERRVVAVADASTVPGVVEATDRLGLTILGSGPRDENVVVSPASAVVALSMLAEGARGETTASLDAALGASGSGRTDAVNALLAALEEYDGDPAVVQDDELPVRPLVHVANQVVLDDQAQVHDAYLEALAAGYGAGVLETDLGTEAGLEPLHRWVRHHTGGLIERSAIQPDPLSRVALQNAVLLAARWDAPFEEHATRSRPFVLTDRTQVEAEAMQQTHERAYAEVDGWRAVRLPYTEGFHADVVLPPDGVDPASITPDQSAALRDALASAAPRAVDLTLPTLDVDAEHPLDLLPAFAAAGLELSDFSGISDQDLALTQAWQQAVLTVDEEGTVAAAVTELALTESAAVAPPDVVELRVDRPYLFTVSHTDTSWALFTAAIRDPRH